MGTDYRFTVKRKFDGKVLGTFYYNRIKQLSDVFVSGQRLKLDLDEIRHVAKFEVEDINNDILRMKSEIKCKMQSIIEKKFMLPMAHSTEIKHEIENDIIDLEIDVQNLINGIEALAGLRSVVGAIVEDMVKETTGEDEDHSCGYSYNAEGMPKTKDGYDPCIWVDDVNIEVRACC